MVVSVVDILSPSEVLGQVVASTEVVTVIENTESPVDTLTLKQATINIINPGGTVANVQWGSDFPPNPTDGQIFIKVV